MMLFLLLAAAPEVFWEQGPQTADQLKKSGIERVAVPVAQAAEWQGKGMAVDAVDPASCTKLPEPGVLFRRGDAAATQRPWVNAAGWQMLRDPSKRYCYQDVGEKALLAAVEAFAYGGNALVKTKPSDLEEIGKLLRFLKQLPPDGPDAPVDFVLVDDGQASIGEVMNLMARRNLMFRVVKKPIPDMKVIQIGTAKYPKADAADPYAFALKVRREIGDEKRQLKVYGSELVIGRVTSGPAGARLHLINYGQARIEGIRVRVKGVFKNGDLKEPEGGEPALRDFAVADGATEFTIPSMRTYAVVELTR
jgi:hypothetical protein